MPTPTFRAPKGRAGAVWVPPGVTHPFGKAGTGALPALGLSFSCDPIWPMTACRNISSGDLPVGPRPATHSHRPRSLGALGCGSLEARGWLQAVQRGKSSPGCRDPWPGAQQGSAEPRSLFTPSAAPAGQDGQQEPIGRGGVPFLPFKSTTP